MAVYRDIAHNFVPPISTTSSNLGRGVLTHIKTLTASSSSTLSFQDGSSSVVMDNTYKTYLFRMMDIHCSTNFRHLGFQFNTAGASGFDETITSTAFEVNNPESGAHQFQASNDTEKHQGTDFQTLIYGIGNENNESGAADLYVFNPSDTTFVTHFYGEGLAHTDDDKTRRHFVSGYVNTTAAVDEIQFKMTEGTIDSGTIKMYGIA